MRPSNNAMRGMLTKHDVHVRMIKSLATGEKRYIPSVGEKELRLSWRTHLYAKIYGNVVATRCKRMAELINKKLQENEENENV